MGVYSGIVDLPQPQGRRLDIYIAEGLRLMRRSQIKARRLCAEVNGKNVKISRVVKTGDKIHLSWEDCPQTALSPEYIPLKIVYEDSHVIVINKQQGLVVHPGAGNLHGTLVNALLWHIGQKTGVPFNASGMPDQRPFIVHRLDKDTSGLLVAAWDTETLSFLADQFKARTVKKVYAAVVKGCPAERSGLISSNIVRDKNDRKRFTVSESAGKSAVTYYKVMRSAGGCSLLQLRPKTGRTHQLRVHLRSIGHPILGDPLYGGQTPALTPRPTLALHAKSLELVLPPGASRSRFTTKLPARFKKLLLPPLT
ncbi:MAG: RluA family pseudouridine synthase [Spirochaetaceae bacterium]|jgi:23S rRNA pseudouridine1911/1915/1917 synthase|nr:RluA family pseudouridine synthase [Spirochaetaceae bacterium]